MSQDASAITSFFAELLVITLVAMLCKRVRIPYTIALVGVGLLLGLTRSVLPLEVTLTPDLLFVVLLPALLFEAAIHLPAQRVMANLKPVVLLAVPGMLITAFGVGYGVHWALGLSLPAALVFGALISATDPISVLALFKELKAPKDLSVVVEGESLLNDGAAVVLFQVLVGAATGHALGLSSSVGLFFLESLGGVLIGAGLGFMACKIHEHLDDAMIEVTLSSILAYGSYLLAQQVHVSGVMAVIAAGFVFGNLAMHQGLSPQSRLVLLYTWEFIGFICNSLVFLLIGTQVDLTLLWQKLGPICLAFLIVILARALAVEPRVLLLDEPFGALDAQVRKDLRRWLRRLHDELHITSVFVTHDQEEALEVADRIVVINHGVVEQVGAPSEVYDHPATPFVYQFLGNVNLFHSRVHDGFAHIGEFAVAAPEHADAHHREALAYVRPHDIDIVRENPDRDALPATIERIQLVGPVARLTLRRQNADETVEAEMPRERYAALALMQDEQVFIRPRRPRIFLR